MSEQALIDGVRHMLHAEEEVVVSERIENSIIALTDTRVVVFSPENTDRRFYSVYLPNVTGFSVQSGVETGRAISAVRTGVYAVLLVGAGVFVDLGNIIEPITAPSGMGIAGILSVINTFIVLLGFVDEVLLVLGLGFLLVTGWFGLRYVQSREQSVSIEVAGGDAIVIPIGRVGEVESSVEHLNQAIETVSMGQRA